MSAADQPPASARQIAGRCLEAALAEATTAGIPVDALGRALIHQVLELWARERSLDDVRHELSFLATNLDEDEFPFMRP